MPNADAVGELFNLLSKVDNGNAEAPDSDVNELFRPERDNFFGDLDFTFSLVLAALSADGADICWAVGDVFNWNVCSVDAPFSSLNGANSVFFIDAAFAFRVNKT